MIDKSRNSAIVRLDSALAEAYGIEKLDDALRVIAEQGRITIGAHQAALSYIPEGNFKVAVHAIALSDKYEKYRSYDVMPSGGGIWALIIEQKVGVCMTHEELIGHPGWKNYSDLKDARGTEHPPLRGWLAVPILAKSGDFVGLLQLSDKYEGEFTQVDLDLLTHLAQLIAPTLELQSVYTQLSSERTLLVKLLDLLEEERQEVAHDIHDGFVQDVVGAYMHLQSIHGALEPANIDSRVAIVAELLQKAIAEGRRLIRDLRPIVLDESGVIEAVLHLIADKRKNDGFTVAFTHEVEFDRLDTRLEGTIFRIVQEALNNVTHHGQVDHAVVQITQIDGALKLVVQDRGVGFNPEHVSADRFGLRGIRERARLFGGTATIESVPGEGTTVTVQLPLNNTCGWQRAIKTD